MTYNYLKSNNEKGKLVYEFVSDANTTWKDYYIGAFRFIANYTGTFAYAFITATQQNDTVQTGTWTVTSKSPLYGVSVTNVFISGQYSNNPFWGSNIFVYLTDSDKLIEYDLKFMFSTKEFTSSIHETYMSKCGAGLIMRVYMTK